MSRVWHSSGSLQSEIDQQILIVVKISNLSKAHVVDVLPYLEIIFLYKCASKPTTQVGAQDFSKGEGV